MTDHHHHPGDGTRAGAIGRHHDHPDSGSAGTEADGEHTHGHRHEGHDAHAGHRPDMFRRRFWVALLFTLPLVATSPMVMDWFGYSLDLPGTDVWVPILGTVVFAWGGWPFLLGGAREARDRRPGMMTLISLAIVVAFVASWAATLGIFEVDVWW